MMMFFLKSGICMLMLWGFYKLILENEKVHRFNRFYLIFSIIFSLVLPFLDFEIQSASIQNTVAENVIPLELLRYNRVQVDEQIVENPFDFTQILWFAWALGSVIFLFRFVRNLLGIYHKIKSNQHVNYQQSKLVLMQETILPCSFLHYIFIKKDEFENKQIETELLQHEQCHAQQLHTLDVIFIEILGVVFWFNPMVYLFKNTIKLNHEFLADDAVNQQYRNITLYQRLLLQKAYVNSLELTSNSTFQLTKQRLMMMTQNTSAMKATAKIALTIAITAMIGFGFSSKIIAQTKPKTTSSTAKQNSLPTEDNFKKSRGILTKGDVDYRNGEYSVLKDHVKGEKIVRVKLKKFDELTEQEKQKIEDPIYTEKNGPPTEEMFRQWCDSDVYGIWVNDKRIENAQLKKYKRLDFVQHDISRLYKNAWVGNRRWQIGLMTNEYYEKYEKECKAKPFFIVDMRTKK